MEKIIIDDPLYGDRVVEDEEEALKHLQGKHDQKTHGSWAGNRNAVLRQDQTSGEYSSLDMFEGSIPPAPLIPELKKILGGSTGVRDADYIQGWANWIEEKTGQNVLDYTPSIDLYHVIPDYPSALGLQYNEDNSLRLKKFKKDGTIDYDVDGIKKTVSAAAVFAHEFGHCVYSKCYYRGNDAIEIYQDKLNTGKGFDEFTNYSTVNPSESFAESFALYMMAGGKKRIKKNVPRNAERVFRVIDQVFVKNDDWLERQAEAY